MKWRCLLFCGGVMVSAVSHAAATIGVVNIQKIVQSSSEGKKIQGDLEKEFNKKKKELESKESGLQEEQKDLEKKKSVLSDEAFGKKQDDFRKQMVQFQDLVSKSQMEMQKRQQELLGPFLDQVKKIVSRVAEEKGLSLVLEDAPNVIFANKASDVTDDVIKTLESPKTKR